MYEKPSVSIKLLACSFEFPENSLMNTDLNKIIVAELFSDRYFGQLLKHSYAYKRQYENIIVLKKFLL